LYSRAKREFGSFEHYQPMEYWKKLLAMVKAEISQSVFQFGKLPPIEYLIDTVDLLLDTIEAEEAPEEDVDELRRIAKRSNAMLLPQARLVLIGASVGEIPKPTYSEIATTPVESVATLTSVPAPILAAPATRPAAAAGVTEAGVEAIAPPAAPPAPQIVAAPAPSAAPAPAAAPVNAPLIAPPTEPAVNPFGLPDTQPAAAPRTAPPPVREGADHPPFGAPFAVPPAPEQAPFTPSPGPTVPGWTWEPPEDDLSGG